jgi:YVTN family beta-propeller protein
MAKALILAASALLAGALAAAPAQGEPPDVGGYSVCVSNERSGDITILDGPDRKVVATIPAGKRPRGIHPSPDGKLLYVAVSGSPIGGPPKLDAKGNPIPEPRDEDDSDRSADGIAVIDLARRQVTKKLPSGSDPEEFAVSRDGKRLYISNEDVATASVLDLATEKVVRILRVKKEPEGVALSPDGKSVYVTCETGGEVLVFDVITGKPIGEIAVGGRPRTIAFAPDGLKAFIPSESAGTVAVVDTGRLRIVRSIRLPDGSRPMGTAMAPDGNRLYVSTGRAGTVCVIDPAAGTVVGVIRVGKRPWGLGISPDGKTLFCANGPSDDVSVIDLATLKEVDRVKSGGGPWGLAIIPASDRSPPAPGSPVRPSNLGDHREAGKSRSGVHDADAGIIRSQHDPRRSGSVPPAHPRGADFKPVTLAAAIPTPRIDWLILDLQTNELKSMLAECRGPVR